MNSESLKVTDRYENPTMPTPSAQSPPTKNPPSPLQLFSVAIWGWMRAHPNATLAEFLDMMEQVERRVKVRPVETGEGGS